MQPIETSASEAFAKLLMDARLRSLSVHDRESIALFVALQYLRSPGIRDVPNQLHEAIGQALGSAGRTYCDFEALDRDQLRKIHGFTMRDAGADLASGLLRKVWCLIRTSPDYPFLLGDCPVTLDHQRAGRIGAEARWVPTFSSTGAEVWLPITPTTALAMFCPTLPRIDRLGRTRARRWNGIAPPFSISPAALAGEQPHWAWRHVVDRLNFNQVAMACRRVYSNSPGFAAARAILRRDPRLARKPQVIMDRQRLLRGLSAVEPSRIADLIGMRAPRA